jgi:hypothetical protein
MVKHILWLFNSKTQKRLNSLSFPVGFNAKAPRREDAREKVGVDISGDLIISRGLSS